MPDWLRAAIDAAERLVPSPVLDVISFTAAALGAIFGSLTGNVSDAWHELAVAFDVLRGVHFDWSGDLLGVLERIILHWIPRYAITAWWWLTHPLELGRILVLYVVHWLEQEAWTIAPYLGKFTLALIVRNIRRILPLVEAIVTAVL